MKRILDVTCGGRTMWFEKAHPDVLYVDRRTLKPGDFPLRPNFTVNPDAVMDFTDLPLPDESFRLVVFDPPHIIRPNDNAGIIQGRYGRLDSLTWRDDIKRGFAECFRVLESEGVLIFKWNEAEVPVAAIIDLAPYPPLFGHRSGKASRTHWLCFMKPARVTPDDFAGRPGMTEGYRDPWCGPWSAA